MIIFYSQNSDAVKFHKEYHGDIVDYYNCAPLVNQKRGYFPRVYCDFMELL